MNSVLLSHITWLMPGVAKLMDRNGDLDLIAERARISPGLIQQGDGWITKRQLYKFYEEAAQTLAGPDFGFAVGSSITAANLGPLGASMAGAATFVEALNIFCRLTPRHVEGVTMWTEIDKKKNGQAWLCTRTEDWSPGLSDVAEHVALATMINVIKIVGGSSWHPYHVRLQASPRPDAERLSPISDCFVENHFSHKAVAFPKEFLTREVPGKFSLLHDPGDILPDQDATVAHRLEILSQSILNAEERIPTSKELAFIAGTSQRSMQRVLAAEGVRLSEINDRIRLKKARKLLKETDMSVKELAFSLGYSGANNFIRAFKRMSGLTPAQFRESR